MRDKQKEETRRRLYHAALEICARDGVQACRIEDIAQKADVSRAAFYFHFPSKDDVLLELLSNCETEILAEVDKLPQDASLKQILETFITSTSRVWSDPNRCKMLIDVFAVQVRRTSILDDREAEVVRASMSRRFSACSARGELSPVIPPEMLSDFYLLNCFAVMAAWGAQPVMPLEDMFRGMTLLFMNGARPPNAQPFSLEK